MNRKTNVELVTEMMEFSRFGALSQLFIIEAIGQYSGMVINSPPEALDGMKGFINPEAWRGVAKEIASKLEARSVDQTSYEIDDN